MAKQDRIWPCTSGRRYRSFCPAEPTTASRCMFPSSGAAQLVASGPSGLYPASSSSRAEVAKSAPPPPNSDGACGASTPAARAASCSRTRSASSTPETNASCSSGITDSAMKWRTRCR
jgi:hypothetical protein